MKNIHLISTDKPSLVAMLPGKELTYSKTKQLFTPTVDWKTQHIYITSDEEIKEGDWLIIIDDFETYVHEHKGDNLPTTYHKKIILTTDQDLIKDGVQAIDDEFLEWFVNNPSCESVEVKPLLSNNGRALFGYKIIILQEKPKFVTVNIESATGEDLGKVSYIPLLNVDYTPKQETLEEANWKVIGTKNDTFYNGAKWMQERMYSEEDMREAYKSCYTPFSFDRIGDLEQDFKKWFEQFKKEDKQ